MRIYCGLLLMVVLSTASAVEKVLDFLEAPLNQTPPGMKPLLAGEGKPGDWKVVLDDAPSAMPARSPQASALSKRPVLAQLGQDPADERFPILILNGETFDDFTFSAKIKMVSGAKEQMAGIVFRLQDEKNFYVLRASALGNTLRFYKVVNGQRGTIIGPETPIPGGEWHELKVVCKGSKIDCFLNGQQLIPTLTDTSFIQGTVGFWTKSDSVSYFHDARITYTPRELPAEVVVRQTIEKYPRLEGLEVYTTGENRAQTRLVAAKDKSRVGTAGGQSELTVINQGATYYGKEKGKVSVLLPLRDRNGEPIAAVRVILKSFPGQTEQNAVSRAVPIVEYMQTQVKGRQDLVE
jgi:hypothetical protein